MSTAMDGQVDIFAELGESAPVSPFTVYVCVWTMPHACGWCGAKNVIGGGGMRNPDDVSEAWSYQYCERCAKKYGHPRMGSPNMEILVNRTVTPRPSAAEWKKATA